MLFVCHIRLRWDGMGWGWGWGWGEGEGYVVCVWVVNWRFLDRLVFLMDEVDRGFWGWGEEGCGDGYSGVEREGGGWMGNLRGGGDGDGDGGGGGGELLFWMWCGFGAR